MRTLGERIDEHARRTPDAEAIVAGERRLTYAALQAGAAAFAARLSTAGVVPGDRVALVADNTPEYAIAVLGIWRAGGIAATIYPSAGAAELEYALVNAAPRLVLVDTPRVEAVAQALAASGHAAASWPLEAAAAGAPDDAPAGGTDPAAACLISYTSGTSSRPKPVVHSHAGVAAAATTYADVWALGPGERTLVCLPLAWIYGLVSCTMATLAGGATAVLLPKYHPARVLEAIERERVTVLPGVTTMYGKLVAFAQQAERTPDLTSLRFCVSGGEARNETAFAAWRELTGRPVFDAYCASEALPVFTYDRRVDAEPRAGSAGRLVPGAELRLLAPDGSAVAEGETGEAFWRAPAQMLGYWDEPALTQEALTPDGWYRTRDRVRLDADGFGYVEGRLSDLIIRGGSNVSPAEVEEVLSAHPDVELAAVVGLPDAEYGERVAAAVVLRAGATLDTAALRAFAAERLSTFKVPEAIVALDELPANAAGKLQRRDVVQLFAERAAR